MKKSHKTLHGFFQSPPVFHLPLLCFLFLTGFASGFGSMGSISAAFGDNSFFCAIDASGKQTVICWGKNSSSESSNPSVYSIDIPPMAALAGGDGFMCGILANTSQAYCWNLIGSSSDLIPPIFQTTSYSHIAAGKDHVCAIRGSYYSDNEYGTTDCWDIVKISNSSFSSKQSSLFYDQFISNLVFGKVVSGEGFSCGGTREDGITCWGPNSSRLEISGVSENFVTLASGLDSLCGVSEASGEVKCWGANASFVTPPVGIRFVSLAAGARHFCGIREDNHVIECWGNFNNSSIPKGSGFLAIASSDFITCGIREDDLVLDCWFANVSSANMSSPPDYDPPLQLCSPGMCVPGSCGEGKFAFNASLLHEPDLTSLCVRKDLNICSPCGLNCSAGFFPSSSCSVNADRPELESDAITNLHPSISAAPCPRMAQIFRLSELKDATNGFKEFNELGRGSYGFVYKAVLPDGRQVAIKRANAATIIHTDSRTFEMELDILCNVRHSSVVNLLGYCAEMGERLLVYEFMPHGTLHDHLHGGLSPLNWTLRLKVAMQAAKGLEYLHHEVEPPVFHRDVKSSNILLDADWGARIADFGLLTIKERDLAGDMRADVYNYGIVLLEILSGRKAYDRDCTPPNIVDWAVPLIRQGKAAATIDRYVSLPRNVEPLLKLADVAEASVRENPSQRPTMSDLVLSLEQIVKDGLTLAFVKSPVLMQGMSLCRFTRPKKLSFGTKEVAQIDISSTQFKAGSWLNIVL
ncbi:hypothetical protein RJ639_034486 [Escallonia herrerae]|uniref:non-specific serine/threonine protein kinase n=1 Tax=Escallonia herrerae TaxID=1293975 RepID=A0AA88WTD1_9ASTE|nr:hypothetical protein RJ639_034486 [Escallonia herrerae]